MNREPNEQFTLRALRKWEPDGVTKRDGEVEDFINIIKITSSQITAITRSRNSKQHNTTNGNVVQNTQIVNAKTI